jgi:beta-lactamase regulating signal transducer with metallopeptidase domain
MENLCGIVAVKACVAVLLALVAALAGRRVKCPVLVHVLWIVVLLELLVPPLLEVGVLPRPVLPGAAGAESAATAVTRPPAGLEVPYATAAIEADRVRPSLAGAWPAALGALWMAGALGVLLLAGVRMWRFSRLLEHATEPTPELGAAASRLAARLRLSRCPRIRLVPANISPMLRPRAGSLELLFPSALLARLRRGERDALLAHELAHVRRGDHWVRLLELIAGALFWWHPVVWWARTRLRLAEEQCCDELVLATLPSRAHDYARGLVKTLEFLAADRPGLPALASGVGGARILEERLTMIMKRRLPRNLSRPQRLVLALVAGAVLVVFPTWADRSAELREQEQVVAEHETEIRESLLALEREAQDLEGALREVRARQRELQAGLERQREELDLGRLEARAAENEAAGYLERAEQLRVEHERLRGQAEIEAERERIALDVERAIAAEEAALRRKMLRCSRRSRARFVATSSGRSSSSARPARPGSAPKSWRGKRSCDRPSWNSTCPTSPGSACTSRSRGWRPPAGTTKPVTSNATWPCCNVTSSRPRSIVSGRTGWESSTPSSSGWRSSWSGCGTPAWTRRCSGCSSRSKSWAAVWTARTRSADQTSSNLRVSGFLRTLSASKTRPFIAT